MNINMYWYLFMYFKMVNLFLYLCLHILTFVLENPIKYSKVCDKDSVYLK